MTEASVVLPENARKAHAKVLQAMQTPGKGGALAIALGTSDATVSRLKSDHLPNVLAMLYALGFKLVDSSAQCVDPEAYAFLTRSHARIMSSHPELIWKSESDFGGAE